MQSSMFALIAFGALLAMVHCTSPPESMSMISYNIKQRFLDGTRTYLIKNKFNDQSEFSILNQLHFPGKQLFFYKNGQELYNVKRDLLNGMLRFSFMESASGKLLGTISIKARDFGSVLNAYGAFGHYKFVGDFRNYSYTIYKNTYKIGMVEKSLDNLSTYGLSLHGDVDKSLLVLFSIIIDELRLF